MLRSKMAQAALLISAALFTLSSQRLPVAAVITVTSNGPTPLAPQLQPPKEPWDNDDSDIDPSSQSHQSWERTWTVGSHTALVDDKDEIVEVKVSIPGRVFLSTAADQAPLAKLRFSGDSAEVLDFFEVVSTSPGVLEIRQRAGLTSDSLTGYLLVEVTLAHIQKLKSVTATGSADVIIENNVLVAYSTSDTVALVVQGSGSIFAHDTTSFSVQQFVLTVAGSGDIELSTAQIEVKTLSATVGGSGNIRLFANSVHAKETALAVAGSGDVFLNSYNFNSDTVAVAVAGSGDVSVYPMGRCSNEQVVIAGSGNAYLGSIACVHANVKIGGSGDAIVQASQTLDGGVVGSGGVKYVGQAPASIAPEASLFSSKKNPKPMAKAARYNKYDEAKIHDLPERTPVHLSIDFASANLTDRALLVPLVLLALLSLWFIRHENNRQNAQAQRAVRAQELQALASAQSQAQVYV